jgi:nucleoid DNA-binding protein
MKKPVVEKKKDDEPALTKRDIAITIADEIGVNQIQATQMVQRMLDLILEALEKGRHVEFRDFGVFAVVTRRSRVGRNPNKPDEVVTIPEHRGVKFKPGKKIRTMFGGK